MYLRAFLRHRSVWLGIAMIWIFLFHSPYNAENPIIFYILSLGYCGVDICFFASGIGCFYSLSSDSDIGRFIRRRFQRIMPTYLIFLFFWFILMKFRSVFSLRMALGNILAVQYISGQSHSFNWYISAILLFYFIAPYFKLFVDRASSLSKIVFLIFLLILSIPFWESTTYMIMVTRLPIFYLGFVIGSWCKNEKKLSFSYLPVTIIMFVIGNVLLLLSNTYLDKYLWSHGLHWYPFILITPALCLWISYICKLCEKNAISKFFINILSVIGDYCFEIYLIHIPLFDVNLKLKAYVPFLNNDFYFMLISILALTVSCFVLRKITQIVQNFISKIKKQHI